MKSQPLPPVKKFGAELQKFGPKFGEFWSGGETPIPSFFLHRL
jgi:hypothetical protein